MTMPNQNLNIRPLASPLVGVGFNPAIGHVVPNSKLNTFFRECFLTEFEGRKFALQLDPWFNYCRNSFEISNNLFERIKNIIESGMTDGEDDENIVDQLLKRFSDTDKKCDRNIAGINQPSKSGRYFEQFCLNKKVPFFTGLELMRACNLACKYCYNSGAKSDILEKTDVISILEKIRKSGGVIINITGGEPTLHEDFIPIIQHAVELGFAVVVRSNLYSIPKGLSSIGETNRVVFVVSFHDCRKEEFDKFTGAAGAHKRILDNIDIIKKMKIPVRAQCVVTNSNEAVMNDIREMFISKNIDYSLSETIFHSVSDRGIKYDKYSFEPSVRAISRLIADGRLQRKRSICNAAASKYWIGCDRRIYPCEMAKNWPLGDALTDDFNSLQVLTRAEEWRNVYTSYYDPKCAACDKVQNCPYCPVYNSQSHRTHHCRRTISIMNTLKTDIPNMEMLC